MRKHLARASNYLRRNNVMLDVYQERHTFLLNDPRYLFQQELQFKSLEAALQSALQGKRPRVLLLIDPFEMSLN